MKIKINGTEYRAKPGETILTSCANVGIKIPTLCYAKNIGMIGSCRVCAVEVKGSRNLVTACNTPVSDKMEIITDSPRVLNARKTVLELLASDHQWECTHCVRTDDCRLKKACSDANCDTKKFTRNKEFYTQDEENRYIRRNNNKCILCGRCVRVCSQNQQVGVLAVNKRGFDAHIGCAWNRPLGDVPCISCGQCVVNCPTGALYEVDRLAELKQKLNDPNMHVVVATAPSVRVALGDGWKMKSGENVTGQMVTALKMLGFDKVFDLDLGADFTIMEEAAEFVKRLSNPDAKIPMFTSCCPGWINYVRMFHPEMLENVSTAKSPMQIFGSVIKSYYSQKVGIPPEKIYTVMLIPCSAKQSECEREEINANPNYKDVDTSLTVRQCIRLMKEYNIDLPSLKKTEFDNPLGLSTGAGLIFGTTGGVMEAALRTLAEKILNKHLDNIDFDTVRGDKGTKTAEVPELHDQQGRTINVAVVSGIANAEKLIQEIKSGNKFYHFVEIMACPGGCVNGGGMPVHNAAIQDNFANAMVRAKTIYHMDKYNKLRRSHENPVILEVYKDYLGEPNGELAHKLLHTHYKPKERYNS